MDKLPRIRFDRELIVGFRILGRPETLRALARSVFRDDVPGIAAEVAFYALFALFPFLLFTAASAAFVVQDPYLAITHLFSLMGRLLPTTTSSMLAELLEGPIRSDQSYVLSFGIVAILWAGSQGFATVLKALSRVYCAKEGKSWWRQRAQSLLMMVPAGLLSMVALTLLAAPDLPTLLAQRTALPHALVVLVSWLRWPFVMLAIALLLGALYSTVPCSVRRHHWISVGGLVAAFAWMAASAALAAYVDRTNLYSRLYGPVGDFLVLMLWLYVGAFVLLLGAEINITITDAKRRARAGTAH